jgi:tripartite ATP-independent transporter DctP family solute receptor
MRLIALRACGMLFGAFLGAAIATSQIAGAAEWRGWNIYPPGVPASEGMEAFAKALAERSQGRLTAKATHSASGDQPEAVKQMRAGQIDYAVFNLGPMGSVIPATNVVSLPFLFKSVDHMHRVMDGPIGEEIALAMADRGLTALAWYDSGARSFYMTQKPITTPDDAKGTKLRVMNDDLFVGMVEALGGVPTPVASGEVYEALKTGAIDGAENNGPSYESSKHFEVATYYSATEHLIIPECLCMNKALWDRLPGADKELVSKAAKDSASSQRKLWAEREKAVRDKLVAAGVKYNEVADKGAFQKAMAPVYAKFLQKNPFLKDIVEKIRAAK